MCLGTGAIGRYSWQPCEQEPPQHAATNWHRHSETSSVEKYSPDTPYLARFDIPEGKEGGEPQSVKIHLKGR